MEPTALDVEKFDAVKELAGIQTEIATGRAVLAELKTSKEAYIEERERETVQRIEGLLAKSEDILRARGGSDDALTRYDSGGK